MTKTMAVRLMRRRHVHTRRFRAVLVTIGKVIVRVFVTGVVITRSVMSDRDEQIRGILTRALALLDAPQPMADGAWELAEDSERSFNAGSRSGVDYERGRCSILIAQATGLPNDKIRATLNPLNGTDLRTLISTTLREERKKAADRAVTCYRGLPSDCIETWESNLESLRAAILGEEGK